MLNHHLDEVKEWVLRDHPEEAGKLQLMPSRLVVELYEEYLQNGPYPERMKEVKATLEAIVELARTGDRNALELILDFVCIYNPDYNDILYTLVESKAISFHRVNVALSGYGDSPLSDAVMGMHRVYEDTIGAFSQKATPLIVYYAALVDYEVGEIILPDDERYTYHRIYGAFSRILEEVKYHADAGMA